MQVQDALLFALINHSCIKQVCVICAVLQSEEHRTCGIREYFFVNVACQLCGCDNPYSVLPPFSEQCTDVCHTIYEAPCFIEHHNVPKIVFQVHLVHFSNQIVEKLRSGTL